jgi:DNA-nicking Smr family endonuclease
LKTRARPAVRPRPAAPAASQDRQAGEEVRRPRVGLLAVVATSARPRQRDEPPDPSLLEAAFDRDVLRALGRGRVAPQAALDLHGMTLVAAERAVSGFLDRAVARDLRLVLIVTGKGIRLEGGRVFGGRIRAEFPGWLGRADNRDRVRAVRAAHPRHGGSGAFYVLLRRRSSSSSRLLRSAPQR